MRRRILLAVEKYPGLHLRAIQRRLETSAMLAEYHLNVLEKLGLITSHIERGYRCFFPVRAGPLALDATDKRWLGLLRRPPILGITLLLLEKTSLPPTTAAEDLQMPLSTTLYQLRQMEAGGLAAQDRHAGRSRFALADPQRVLELLRSNHPTPDMITRYADMWDRILHAMGGPPPAPPETVEEEVPETSLPDALRRAAHSVRKVYAILTDGPFTGQELVLESGLARRTVYAALNQLKELGLLEQQGHLKDMRQTQFWVRRRENAPTSPAPPTSPDPS